MNKWKIRVMLPSGELGEVEFQGTLAEAEALDFGGPIMVVQRVALPVAEKPAGSSQDAAKGADSVSIKKN